VLEEKIYMVQPPGFEVGGSNTVCLLNKCIYGLKQAPLVWHKTLKAAFSEYDYVVSHFDPGVLIVKDGNNKKNYALIYVDDNILTGPSTEFNKHIQTAILKKFPGKALGQAEFFTGMKIERDLAKKTIKLVQTRHIDDLVKQFGQTDARPAPVPIDTNLDLSSKGSKPHVNIAAYMSLVGSLLYLAITTRPDIAYAASLLARFMSCPTHFH
jgi:hypothetical protein